MSKMYVVKYSEGSYHDWREVDLFVTNKKRTATKYVAKFNKTLKKWKEHYKKYEYEEFGMTWIEDQYVEKYFSRWNRLRDINKCYYEEIEIR